MKRTDQFGLIAVVLACSIWLLPGVPGRSQNAPAPAFHDDFQGALGDNWIVGGRPALADTTFLEQGGAYYRLVPDTNNYFGKGATHQVLLIHDFSKTNQVNLVAENKFQLEIFTLSFDFYEASDPDSNGGPLVVRLGNVGNNDTDKVLSINLDHGKLQTMKNVYAFDIKHHLDLVANNTNAPVPYSDTHSIPPQTFDVWLDGLPVMMKHPMEFLANLKGSTQFSSLSFLTYTSGTVHAEFLLDDVSVTEGAVVTPAGTKPPVTPSPPSPSPAR